MLHLAVRMAGHRITALLAVACAVLGGAALITGTGVLAESGLRSQLPAGRLAGADVVVSTDQSFRPAGDLPIALPERGTVPAALVDPRWAEALAAVVRRGQRRSLEVAKIDGAPARESNHADTFRQAGFVDGYKGLVIRRR
jgi:hypothetical protein